MAKCTRLAFLPSKLAVIVVISLVLVQTHCDNSCCHAKASSTGILTSGMKLDLVRSDSNEGWLKRSIKRSLARRSNSVGPRQARIKSESKSQSEESHNITIEYQLPITSDGMGSEFVSRLALGTPPVSFTAVVDTGSGLVWRQCTACNHLAANTSNSTTTDDNLTSANNADDVNGCYVQTDGTPIFDPGSSSTYRALPCNDTLCNSLQTPPRPVVSCGSSAATAFSNTTFINSTINYYASIGSISSPYSCIYNYVYDNGDAFTAGVFSTDILTLGYDYGNASIRIPSFAFGCGELNRAPDNFTGAGGVIGLSRAPLSLTSQMHLSQFSYCLRSDASTSSLFLGPVPPPLGIDTGEVICTTPILTNPSHPHLYYVNLTGISIAGKRLLDIPPSTFSFLPDGGGGTIIDSGTTLTFFPYAAYASVLNALMQFNASMPLADPNPDFDLCYTSPGNVGSFTLHFADGPNTTNLTLPTANYFTVVEGYGYCLLLGLNFGSYSLLGNMLQQNFHITFDLEASRLSFATPSSSTCGYFS